MDWAGRRAQLATLLKGEFRRLPAAYDPISAKLARMLSFEAAMVPGSLAALGLLGVPDLTLMTLTELAGLVLRMSMSCDLPLVIDADHGYGNALNVMRTVRELEVSGAAGLTIEDTVLPAPFGYASHTTLVSIAEAEGKLKASVQARSARDFAIFARVNANGLTGGQPELLERVACFQTTGVDGLFLAGLKSRDQLAAVVEVATLPIFLGLVPEEMADPSYLRGSGVKLHFAGHAGFDAGLLAMHKALQAESGSREVRSNEASDLVRSASDATQHAEWQKAFL